MTNSTLKTDLRLEICNIISAMLDDPGDCGIFHTGKCFDALEALFERENAALRTAIEVRNKREWELTNELSAAVAERDLNYARCASLIFSDELKNTMNTTVQQWQQAYVDAKAELSALRQASADKQPAPVNKWCSWCRTATHSDAECHATRRIPRSKEAAQTISIEESRKGMDLQGNYRNRTAAAQAIPGKVDVCMPPVVSAPAASHMPHLATETWCHVCNPSAAATTGAWGSLAGSQSESPAPAVPADTELAALTWLLTNIAWGSGDTTAYSLHKLVIERRKELLATTQEAK